MRPVTPQPEWRDPAGLPAIQYTRTGAFGEKLAALDRISAEFRDVMASIDADGLSDPEVDRKSTRLNSSHWE